MSDSFLSIVKNLFGFLVEKHGFRVVQENRASIVYQSAACELSLYYDDQRSFEVGLGLARRFAADDPPFNFGEILRAQKVPEAEWSTGYSAGTLNDARALCEKMAAIVGIHACELLDGNPQAWARLVELRKSDCLLYAKETGLRQAKAKAEEAWSKREYAKVVAALESVDGTWLGKADLAKLEYARRAISAH